MKPSISSTTAALCALAMLAGCGGGGGSTAASVSPSPSPSVSDSQRIAAATTTAQTNAACSVSTLGSYYWEIGDASGAKASGSMGSGVGATTTLSIASASKWIYGAYVVQRQGGVSNLSATNDLPYLHFTSGYTNFTGCSPLSTVDSCLNAASNGNGQSDPATVGKFDYNGGHMQKHASLLGLGSLDAAGFAAEMQRVLGSDVAVDYSEPQPAGGVRTSASVYAVFLRKLLTGSLLMSSALGADQVCTATTNNSVCSTAAYTPVPAGEYWNYSVGHWVEDATASDGSYSSPGAFGFYPWIDPTKTYYGIISRQVGSGVITGIQEGYTSSLCGRLLRKAWNTGTPQ